MKNRKLFIISIVLCLLPCVLGIALWGELPDKVPTHFDINNEPDQYSSKAFAVFGIPAILALIDAVCIFAMKADPKRERQSKAMQNIILFFVPLLSCLLMPIMLLVGMGKRIDVTFIVTILIGFMLVIIGNYLPKCRQNYTMGIRLPWTLASEDNWNYTHRLGGFCFVIGGILSIIASFLGLPWAMLVIVACILVITTLASYIFYRKHK